MSKETEEIIIIAVVGFLLLSMLQNNSGGAQALQLAKLNASQNTSYANDAASVVSSIFGGIGSDDNGDN